MSRIGATHRLISAYAETEPELWKTDHDWAMFCGEIEDGLEWGVRLFRGLCEVDSRRQARVLHGEEAPDVHFLDEIEGVYRLWISAAEGRLTIVDNLTSRGYTVAKANELRASLEEAKCLLANIEFERELPPNEEVIALVKPDNPRPERYGD